MSELGEKVKASIERLKAFEPRSGEGYYLAFSGGKDSVVIKALADMAGVKYDAHYSVTSVDPPELVQFISTQFPDVSRDVPRYPSTGKPATMWNLIPRQSMPPTRLFRYCCRHLKERGGDGRMTITGVRWAESINRKKNQGLVTVLGKQAGVSLADDPNFTSTNRGGVVLVNDNDESRRVIEHCYKRHKTTVNPIIDWTDGEIWEFTKAETLPSCCLYQEGFDRLGCIGCPNARTKGREIQFNRWPKYKENYLAAFRRMLEARTQKGKESIWKTPEDVYNWWMQYDILPGQTKMILDEMEEDEA